MASACRSRASPATSRRRCSGRRASTPGLAKNTYGTGCFLLLNTGDERRRVAEQPADDGRVEARRDDSTTRSKAASSSAARSCSGCATGCSIIRTAADVEALAASVPDNGGVYFVPAFAGLGAPHWDPYARGAIFGLTRGATAGAHRARGARVDRVPERRRARRDAEGRRHRRSAELRVDGGATANDLLMQFQADVLGVPVVRPQVLETTALGAAYLAGLAVGYWKGDDEIAANWHVDRRFEPKTGSAANRAIGGTTPCRARSAGRRSA